MKLRQVLIPGWVALTLMLIFLTVAVAGGEGRLSQMEGRMDLLKGGKLPAVPPGCIKPLIPPSDCSSRTTIFVSSMELRVFPQGRANIFPAVPKTIYLCYISPYDGSRHTGTMCARLIQAQLYLLEPARPATGPQSSKFSGCHP